MKGLTADAFGLSDFQSKLERFLTVEHGFVDGALVVALAARFGAGKSTFLKLWNADLLGRAAEGESMVPIVLDAWEGDFCGDPLLSILAGLVEATQQHANENMVGKLKEAAADVGWFSTAMANGVIAKFTGLDPVKAGGVAEKKKAERQKRPDFIQLFEQRRKAFDDLKEALKSLYGGDEPKAVVFVDELDRCRPDYAIGYLETIKHVFDIEGMVFVLAVDKEQLASSAKALFGEGLNFDEYFRKFCHRTVNLPAPDERGHEKLIAGYADRYLRSYRLLHREQQIIFDLIKTLHLTPRQIQEAFRCIGHAISEIAGAENTVRKNILGMSIILAFLQVGEEATYLRMTGQQMYDKEVKELFQRLGCGGWDWWFKVYLVGIDRNASDISVAVGAKLSPIEESSMCKDWGGASFARVVEVIEKVGKFGR